MIADACQALRAAERLVENAKRRSVVYLEAEAGLQLRRDRVRTQVLETHDWLCLALLQTYWCWVAVLLLIVWWRFHWNPVFVLLIACVLHFERVALADVAAWIVSWHQRRALQCLAATIGLDELDARLLLCQCAVRSARADNATYIACMARLLRQCKELSVEAEQLPVRVAAVLARADALVARSTRFF